MLSKSNERNRNVCFYNLSFSLAVAGVTFHVSHMISRGFMSPVRVHRC
jgi:hypothetical protein